MVDALITDLPSLDEVACALELHAELQPYKSSKRQTFYGWDQLEPTIRIELLEVAKVPFCTFHVFCLSRKAGLN